MKHNLFWVAAILLAACANPAVSVNAEDDPRFKRITAYADFYERIAAFDGVILIAEGDKINYHKAFGKADYRFDIPMTTDVRFRIASLSKQFAQGAIARLVDRGLVDLNAPVSEYLPEFPNAERMTVSQLLDGSSGVKHTNKADWMKMHQGMTLDEIMAKLAEEPLDFEPGTSRRYSNGGYSVAAAVIESVSGLSFAEFIQTEIAQDGYPSVGHEDMYAVIENMASRYAPGPQYKGRVEASQYIVANRIGGGSLHANADDVFRFFRNSYSGALVTSEMTKMMFEMPDDGDTRITGRSPGALAQVYYSENDDLTVVTLSSNSAWPGSFNEDITAFYRQEEVKLQPVTVEPDALTDVELVSLPGRFELESFGWDVTLKTENDQLVYAQDEIRTAFIKTESGDFYLPIWDWQCEFDDGCVNFTCRQRKVESTARFVFKRVN